MVALGRMEEDEISDDAPLAGSQCAVCRKSMNMTAEDWLDLEVQVGDVTVRLVVCEEHAGVIRARAARRITQIL